MLGAMHERSSLPSYRCPALLRLCQAHWVLHAAPYQLQMAKAGMTCWQDLLACSHRLLSTAAPRHAGGKLPASTLAFLPCESTLPNAGCPAQLKAFALVNVLGELRWLHRVIQHALSCWTLISAQTEVRKSLY